MHISNVSPAVILDDGKIEQSSISSEGASNIIAKIEIPRSSASKTMPVIRELTEKDVTRIDIVDDIGRGQYGMVKKVKNIPGYPSDLNCALKITEYSDGSLGELNLHKQLNHKNIIQILAYHLSKKEIISIMELAPMSLYNLFNLYNEPSMKQKIKILKGICAAISYLHLNVKYSHHDLKSENILINNNYMPKLADFGMSNKLGTRQYTYNPECFYQAPEASISNNKENIVTVSEKHDNYSLGALSLGVVVFKDLIFPWVTFQKSESLVEDSHNGIYNPVWYDKYHQEKFSSTISFNSEEMPVSYLVQNISPEDVKKKCKIQNQSDIECIDTILKEISFPAMSVNPDERPDAIKMYDILKDISNKIAT